MARLLTASLLFFAVAEAQTPPLADYPRDAKGRLQAFDCGLVFRRENEPGRKPHKCDPVDFAKVLRGAKTVALVAAPSLRLDVEAPRKHAETLIRSWGHFRVVDDPESADLVFQLFLFHRPPSTTEFPQLSGVQIQVWPRGGNPQSDDPVWMETYFAKWPEGDAVAAVVKLLRKDIEDCERLSSR